MKIPVNIVPTDIVTDLPYMAVECTGDAGFGVTDRKICKTFSTNGIPAVSINSFLYFLTKRTPVSAADDCVRLIKYFGYQWNRSKVILIGYSFGADALPFIYNNLPEDIKNRISLLVLISPAYKADFIFHLSSWFGHTRKDALPVLPEINKINNVKILCFYGRNDKESSGPEIEREKLAKVISFNTGHRMGHNGSRIVNEILKMIDLKSSDILISSDTTVLTSLFCISQM